MAKQTPISIILSLLGSLTERDKARLKKELMKETPCELKGHNFKVVRQSSVGFFNPKVITTMVCIKCGQEKIT